MTKAVSSELLPKQVKILENQFKLHQQASFSNLSIEEKREICDLLGRGWEWEENDVHSGGCKRLRSWWRLK